MRGHPAAGPSPSAKLPSTQATLDASTRRQFDEVYAAIRALIAPPESKRRSIGFTADLNE